MMKDSRFGQKITLDNVSYVLLKGMVICKEVDKLDDTR
ncbi:hypothetical protein ERS140147_01720 [Staphylococcus schweitzeri]|uniref:Uncharacterized protein n=1 Tax=Staphylococcus schweitzeri TaxID=1654388 RepID=A0A077UML8_9STAP|nr:hypothetical protein ERS140147_01720 [Staphylococcus schweitzeri]